MGQRIGREDVVDLKWLIKRYWGNNNVCVVFYLDKETLDGGFKSAVAIFIRAIDITFENVIALCDTDI